MCFGWVDSQLKGLDERCYTLRYTPRKPNSIWSMSNIRRVEQLIAEGRMTDAGLQKIAEAKANGQWDAAIRREQVDVIPAELESASLQVEGGAAAYHALTDSARSSSIYWLQTAKTEATRQRRIQQIVDEALGGTG